MSKYSAVAIDLDEEEGASAQSQLEFQNFVLNSAEQNLHAKSQSKPLQPAPSSSSQPQPDFFNPTGQNSTTNNTSTQAFWTVQFYAQFFDVDTSDVVQRIIAALLPFKSSDSNFMDKIAPNPDLYGPFWIPTTVIFSLFITSFIAGSINAYFGAAEYIYDMTRLSFASTLVYSYLLATSAAIWGLGRYFGCPVKALEVVGLVGYGMVIWVPVSLLSVIPLDILRTALAVFAFALTSYSFIQNITPTYSGATNPIAKTTITAVIVGANAFLALMLRYGFFAFTHWAVNRVGGGRLPVEKHDGMGVGLSVGAGSGAV